ncbi:hypothetical protein [Subtercola boreus]|uniref:Bacterial Ig-like domain-containing protein n=1 Tax=Subtercola boreus TaxID=120213 RepID=A0A3E0W9Q8_9MICO|nr:hypothetical protein [Subtercola boreus]RFA20043.1 hypothetical protein B7R24_10730 [Subtercola boreus]RFA20172.1 hypothetical protein B7R23_10670 [Subtercola boreus]RFA26499.1 hypothetical protein B7R25_10795 [Subtercola boreus]
MPVVPAPGASRFRLLMVVAALGLLVPLGASALQGAAPAAAEEQPTATAAPAALATAEPIAPVAPTPTPSPSDPPAAPTPIVAPQITSPAAGTLQSGSFVIAGTAEPNSRVQVSASTRSDPLCATTASSDGAFTCSTGTLPSAPGVVLRVVQLVDGHDNASDTVTVDVLNAPTVASGSASGISTGYGTVRGTALAAATVTASASGAAGIFSCTVAADVSGAWACNLGDRIPSGTVQVRATQSTSWSRGPSAQSPAFALQIDSDAPAPPRVTSPTAGASAPASGTAFAGTGESGSLVTVFAGSFAACTAPVQNGVWGCEAGELATGTVAVSAIQQDPAGNVSAESAPVSVTFRAGSATPTPSATAPGGSTTTPGTGGGGAPGSGASGAGSGATGSGSAGTGTGTTGSDGSSGSGSTGGGSGLGDAPQTPGSGTSGASGGGTGGSPSGDGGTTGAPGGTGEDTSAPLSPLAADGTWAGATRFTTTLQPVFGTAAGSNWLIAAAIALGVLALIAAPARLMAGALSVAAHNRRGRRGTLLTGRNRPRDEFERAPQVSVNPRVLAAIALVASALIGMLSGPIESQPAYLRLLGAICIAFAVLNAVSVALPRVLGLRMLGLRSRIAFAPHYLAIAAVVMLASRAFAIEPALLFGLVLAIGPADGTSVRGRARFALLHLLSLVVLGGAAWAAATVLPAATTPASAFLTEVLNTIVLGSFGAAAVLVLPFGALAGRAVFAWSRTAWLAAALGCFTLLAAVLLPAAPSLAVPAASSGLGATWVLIVAVGFAAVSLSVWTWVRFIAPALR